MECQVWCVSPLRRERPKSCARTTAPESELFAKDGGATALSSVSFDARALCAQNLSSNASFAGQRSPYWASLSELELAAQDEAELEANEECYSKHRTSNSEYDSDSPYCLWGKYLTNKDDGTIDEERLEDQLERDNADHNERRNFRASSKLALSRRDQEELADLLHTRSSALSHSQHLVGDISTVQRHGRGAASRCAVARCVLRGFVSET
eukprot:6182404-Pleurochrysis_carterae.AAC.1